MTTGYQNGKYVKTVSILELFSHVLYEEVCIDAYFEVGLTKRNKACRGHVTRDADISFSNKCQ